MINVIAQSSGKIARVKKLVRMVFRYTNNCLYCLFSDGDPRDGSA